MSTKSENLKLTIPALADNVGDTILAIGQNFQTLDENLFLRYKLLTRIVTTEDTTVVDFPLDLETLKRYLDLKILVRMPEFKFPTSNVMIHIYPNGETTYSFYRLPLPDNTTTTAPFGGLLRLSPQESCVRLYSCYDSGYVSLSSWTTGLGTEHATHTFLGSTCRQLMWKDVTFLRFQLDSSSYFIPAGAEFLLTGFQYR